MNNKNTKSTSTRLHLRHKLILLAVLALAACGVLWLQARQKAAAGQRYVTVSWQGNVIYEAELATVTETTSFTAGNADAYNIIQVSPEGIGVIEANCPDQVCVKQGIRSHGPEPIVCLPHRLSIRFSAGPDQESGSGLDAITGR